MYRADSAYLLLFKHTFCIYMPESFHCIFIVLSHIFVQKLKNIKCVSIGRSSLHYLPSPCFHQCTNIAPCSPAGIIIIYCSIVPSCRLVHAGNRLQSWCQGSLVQTSARQKHNVHQLVQHQKAKCKTKPM